MATKKIITLDTLKTYDDLRKNSLSSAINLANSLAEEAQASANTAKAAKDTAVATSKVAEASARTAQASAETARAAAETAASVAEVAQATADAASATADTAMSTAETAKATADTAQSTAETAKATAETAQRTAETASATASVADATAKTAEATANTAMSTAETAKATAETAQATASVAASAASVTELSAEVTTLSSEVTGLSAEVTKMGADTMSLMTQATKVAYGEDNPIVIQMEELTAQAQAKAEQAGVVAAQSSGIAQASVLLASDARKAADDAQASANSAQTSADEANEFATEAKQKSQEAADKALAAESAATAAAGHAEDAALSASNAEDAAGKAKDHANNADKSASDAQKSAEEAQKDAKDAKSKAEQAAKSAEAADRASSDAINAAKDAINNAEDAAKAANDAAAEADKAKEYANQAGNYANEAAKNVLGSKLHYRFSKTNNPASMTEVVLTYSEEYNYMGRYQGSDPSDNVNDYAPWVPVKGEKGSDGVSFKIKASKDLCQIEGDGYLDENGHLLVLDNVDERHFIDVGEIKGPKGEIGPQGPAGEQGIQGEKGDTGESTYFHVKYSNKANPTDESDMTETPSKYIGTYVDGQLLDSKNPADYTWHQFFGDDGQQGPQGTPGVNGANGKTSYFHVKYSDDGENFTANKGETPGDWLGEYVDFKEADSDTFSDYHWTHIKGEQGIQGIPGKNGTPKYTWIKYAKTVSSDGKSGTGMNDSPDGCSYMGIAFNKDTSEESTSFADYKWSLIKGEDGEDGNGIESIEYYYATTKTYTAPSNGSFLWGGKGEMKEPTVEQPYLWQKEIISFTKVTDKQISIILISIKGKDGTDGKDGVSMGTLFYATSASNYSQPPSSINENGWSDAPVTPTSKLPYVYVSIYKHYSNGTYEFEKPTLFSSLEGMVSLLSHDGIDIITYNGKDNNYKLNADKISGTISENVTIAGFDIGKTSIDNLLDSEGRPNTDSAFDRQKKEIGTGIILDSEGKPGFIDKDRNWYGNGTEKIGVALNFREEIKGFYSNDVNAVLLSTSKTGFSTYDLSTSVPINDIKLSEDVYVDGIITLHTKISFSSLIGGSMTSTKKILDPSYPVSISTNTLIIAGSETTGLTVGTFSALSSNSFVPGLTVDYKILNPFTLDYEIITNESAYVYKIDYKFSISNAKTDTKKYENDHFELKFKSGSDIDSTSISGSSTRGQDLVNFSPAITGFSVFKKLPLDWSLGIKDSFGVTRDGMLFAQNARVSGQINTTSGNIGGFNINTSSISSRDNKLILSSDGSITADQVLISTEKESSNDVCYIANLDKNTGFKFLSTYDNNNSLKEYTLKITTVPNIEILWGFLVDGVKANPSINISCKPTDGSSVDSKMLNKFDNLLNLNLYYSIYAEGMFNRVYDDWRFSKVKFGSNEVKNLPSHEEYANKTGFGTDNGIILQAMLSSSNTDGNIEYFDQETSSWLPLDKFSSSFSAGVIGESYSSYYVKINGTKSDKSYDVARTATYDVMSIRLRIKPTTSELRSLGSILPNDNKVSLGSSTSGWNSLYAGSIYYKTSYSQSSNIEISDRDVKNTIEDISNEYDMLYDSLKPVTFKLNNGSSDRTHTGFIAQDVKESIINSGLSTKDFAGYCEFRDNESSEFLDNAKCGLRYEEFIPLNTLQIQKLKQRVADLENDNLELKRKLSEVLEKLDKLNLK